MYQKKKKKNDLEGQVLDIGMCVWGSGGEKVNRMWLNKIYIMICIMHMKKN